MYGRHVCQWCVATSSCTSSSRATEFIQNFDRKQHAGSMWSYYVASTAKLVHECITNCACHLQCSRRLSRTSCLQPPPPLQQSSLRATGAKFAMHSAFMKGHDGSLLVWTLISVHTSNDPCTTG